MAVVEVEHPKTTELYRVDLQDYRRKKVYRDDKGEYVTLEAAGFKIVRNADGSEYEEPKTATRSDTKPAESKS